MRLNDAPVSFPVFFIIDFYDRFDQKVRGSDLDEAQKELLRKLITKLVNYDDPMIPVEELATVHAASEITIFVSDLIERTQIEEAEYLMLTSMDLASDLLELISLMIEEDTFHTELEEFLTGVDISMDDSTATPAAVGAPVESGVVADFTSEIVEENEAVVETHAPVAEPVNDEISFHAAFDQTLTNGLKNLNADRRAFVLALIPQLTVKQRIQEKILPSEINNLLQLVDESYQDGGRNLLSNMDLIISNVNQLTDAFIAELKTHQWDVIDTIEADAVKSPSEMPSFERAPTHMDVDPEIKGKLRLYFKHEVQDFVRDTQKILETIDVHTVSPNKFNNIKKRVTGIKDVAIIHGYESIELLANELFHLMDEAVEDNLVFTTHSESLLKSAIDRLPEVVDLLDQDSEAETVKAIISVMNEFNQSLGVLELTDEELFPATDMLVHTEFQDIVKSKIRQSGSISTILPILVADYKFYPELPHALIVNAAATMSRNDLADRETELKMLLQNEISLEDAELFVAEVTGADTPESDSTGTDAETDSPKIETEPAPKRESTASEDEFKRGQTFTFTEIKERFNIYETILLRKLEALINGLESGDAETVIVKSNQIEVEIRMMGYEQLADFFNYFTLSDDDYSKAESNRQLIDELRKIIGSPSTYTFNIDDFSDTREVAVADETESDNSDGADDWIDSVADVIESTGDTISLDPADVKISPMTDDIDPEIIEIFNDEASSYMETVRKQIEFLERNQQDSDALEMAEKGAHTLKSAAKMLNITTIGDIAEKVEKVFEAANSGKQELTTDTLANISKLLNVIDNLMAGNIEAANAELPTADDSASTERYEEDESDDDIEMLEIFQEESSEHISNIDQALIQLSSEPERSELIRTVESNAQALKSAAKMLGFKRIGNLAETLETTAETVVRDDIRMTEEAVTHFRKVLTLVKELALGNTVSIEAYDTAVQQLSDVMAAISQSDGPSDAAETNADMIDSETVELFLEEVVEIIDRISSSYQTLEQSPENTELLQSLGSDFFTLSSSASSAGFRQIAKLTVSTEKFINSHIDVKKMPDSSTMRLIHRVVSEIVKLSRTIEETRTDQTDTVAALIEDIRNAAVTPSQNETASVSADVDLRSLIDTTTEIVTQRSQFNQRVQSLKSLMKTIDAEKLDAGNRTVVLKNIQDVVAKVDELSQSIDDLSHKFESNLQQIRQLAPDADAAGDSEMCHVFEFSNERFAIKSSKIGDAREINLDDTIITDKGQFTYIDDTEFRLVALADLIGVSEAESVKMTGYPLKHPDASVILMSNQFESSAELRITPVTDSGKNLCDATAFADNEKLVFVLNESELFSKLGLAYSSGGAKVQKLARRTVIKGQANALVADDSVSIRKFLGDVLINIGFTAVTANDGEDAISKLGAESYDLIITDIEMPGKNGYEFIQAVRGKPEFDAVPIIVLTGRSSSEDKDRAMTLGANSYVLKPFKEMELRAKLSEFFDIKTAQNRES